MVTSKKEPVKSNKPRYVQEIERRIEEARKPSMNTVTIDEWTLDKIQQIVPLIQKELRPVDTFTDWSKPQPANDKEPRLCIPVEFLDIIFDETLKSFPTPGRTVESLTVKETFEALQLKIMDFLVGKL